MMDRKRRDIISSIFLLAIAMVVFIEVAKLPIGSMGAPRLGFWPLIQAVLLTILSLILLAQAKKKKEQVSTPFWGGPGSWKRFGMTLGALFAFGFFYEVLGFITSVFLLMLFLSRVVGAMEWRMAITVAIASSVCSYCLFGVLLDTSLPGGILGF